MSDSASRDFSCPLTDLGVRAVDRVRQISTATDAAYTEGANIAAMAECGANCGIRGFCLANNPDETEESDVIKEYLMLFEQAVSIGRHRPYSMTEERLVTPHSRYGFRL